MLAVCCTSPGCAAQRPPVVGVGDQTVGVGHHPRFEREQQAGAQHMYPSAVRPAFGTCGSWCMAEPMPWPPNSVLMRYPTPERTSSSAWERAPRCTPGSATAIAAASARSGGGDHRDVLKSAGVADDEADRGVRGDAVLLDGEAEGQEVSVREPVVAGHADRPPRSPGSSRPWTRPTCPSTSWGGAA